MTVEAFFFRGLIACGFSLFILLLASEEWRYSKWNERIGEKIAVAVLLFFLIGCALTMPSRWFTM